MLCEVPLNKEQQAFAADHHGPVSYTHLAWLAQHYPNQRTVLPPARLFCQADAAGTCSGIRYAETVPER